jgi:hypothetical protein
MAAPNKFVGNAKTICIHNIYMGNIINGTSQHIFGLAKREVEEKIQKKRIYPVPPIRNRGLYALVHRFIKD